MGAGKIGRSPIPRKERKPLLGQGSTKDKRRVRPKRELSLEMTVLGKLPRWTVSHGKIPILFLHILYSLDPLIHWKIGLSLGNEKVLMNRFFRLDSPGSPLDKRRDTWRKCVSFFPTNYTPVIKKEANFIMRSYLKSSVKEHSLDKTFFNKRILK